MKNIKVHTWILFCLILLLEYLIDRLLCFLWLASLNLIWYFLDVVFWDTGWYLIPVFCVHIYVFCVDKYVEHSDDEGRLIKRNKDKISDSFWKDKASRIYVISLCGVLAVITVIVNLTPTANQYSNILIEDEKVSKLEYKYRILRDWASNNIVSEDILSENVSARRLSRDVKTYRPKRGVRTVFAEYIIFENEDGTVSCYPLEFELFKYMYKKNQESVPSFTVTYYKESGVVVAVDGYTVNDLKKQYETE